MDENKKSADKIKQTYQNFKIDKDYKSVYFFLKENGFSENFITNLRKQAGFILINENVANTASALKKSDVLSVISNPNRKTTIMQCILPLDIVFEDAYYLLINKPSELSTMPNKSHYTNNLAGAICQYMSQKDPNFTLRVVNRLDKDTSGLVLVAKSALALKELSSFEKKYHAICEGIIDKDMVVDQPILTIQENGINNRKRVISPDGQKATTYIRPLKQLNNNLSLIELILVHGRTHQIRVHLSSIGHPLLGDELYGSTSPKIDHTALICKEVSFYHPYLKKTLSFSAPYPDDFKLIIEE